MAKKKGYINPGYLVVGQVYASGCVTYVTRERTQKMGDNKFDADWRTHKHVKNVKENTAVRTERARLNGKIGQLGTFINHFGYFVPIAKGKELEETLKDIEIQVQVYNKQARLTRLTVDFAVFQISSSDDRIAAALYRKAVELLEQMAEYINDGDVRKLRQLFGQMKSLDRMLPEDTSEKLSSVMKDARDKAKQAVKKMKKVDQEKAKTKIAKKVLKSVPVEKIRADLIETVDSIGKRNAKTKFIAPVKARQIETD